MNLHNIYKKKGGFSLIELVVVLVIIAIIAAITVPNLGWFINDANEEELIAQGNVVLVHLESTTVELRKEALNSGKTLQELVEKRKEVVLREAGLVDKVLSDQFFIIVEDQQLKKFQYKTDDRYVYYNGTKIIVNKTPLLTNP